MRQLAYAFASLVGFAAVPASAAPLKSPYFVDGIHCEGLEEGINTDHVTSKYSDPEVAAVGIKIARQDYCEAVFSQFGVQKFQWLTPEDLENVSFKMRHSGNFAQVDIELQKSDLQNHVHVIGKFKMFEARFHAVVASKSTLERGASAGDRKTEQVHAAAEFAKRGDVNPAPAILSIDAMNTTAPRALAAGDLSGSSTPVTLTPEEAAAQSKVNGTYEAINLRLNMPRKYLFEQFVDVGFSSTKETGDHDSTFDTKVQIGASIDTDQLIPSKLSLLILYGTYQAGPAATVISSGSPGSRSITFAGIADSVRTRRFDVDLQFYRSLSAETHYFYDANVLWKIGNLLEIDHGIGVEQHLVQGAILPEQRFGLPNRDEVYLFYRAATSFTAFGNEQTLALKAGQATYNAVDDTDTPYSRRSPFVELDYVTHASSIDVNLGFVYGSQRLY